MSGGRDWKSAMLTLDDTAFFDIMRAWLGPVRTPFNKHTLIDTLVSRLSNPEVRRRIFLLIDGEDRKVMSAVRLLGEPEEEKLYGFFENEISFVELHHHILNLEERLLLYREKSDGKSRLRINPYLLEDLLDRVIDPLSLFPSRTAEPIQAPVPWMSDTLLASVLSWILGAGEILKNDGGLRKKAETDLTQIFPDLFVKTDDGTRLFLLLDTLASIGLMEKNGATYTSVLDAWKAAAGRSRQERYAALWAAAAGTSSAGQALAGFLVSLPVDRAFGRNTLERLAGFMIPTLSTVGAAHLFRSLASLGLLIRTEADEYRKNPHTDAFLSETVPAEPAVVLQPNFMLTLKPWVPLRDALTVALAAEIRRYDLYPQFEITREAAARAFRLGTSAAEIVKDLETLTGSPLPQNIVYTLTDWEKEYRSVSLFRGVVLMADEERRHLVEHTAVSEHLVSRILAPGVYLVAEEDVGRLMSVLSSAGIRMAPELETVRSASGGFRPTEGNAGVAFGSRHHPDGSARIAGNLNPFAGDVRGTNGPPLPDKGEAEALTAELISLLESKAFPSDIRETLADRIRKKLLILPEQLNPEAVRKEKTEARGLDYLGKVRLIEQAIRTGNELLEIIVRTPDGEPDRMLVSPRSLDKRGSDLILTGTRLPNAGEESVHVSRMAFVRKIRGSLYRG